MLKMITMPTWLTHHTLVNQLKDQITHDMVQLLCLWVKMPLVKFRVIRWKCAVNFRRQALHSPYGYTFALNYTWLLCWLYSLYNSPYVKLSRAELRNTRILLVVFFVHLCKKWTLGICIVCCTNTSPWRVWTGLFYFIRETDLPNSSSGVIM